LAREEKRTNKKVDKSNKKTDKYNAGVDKHNSTHFADNQKMHQLKSINMATVRMIEGDKPERSDYKGSKPQRATGSSASKERIQNLVQKIGQKRKMKKN